MWLVRHFHCTVLKPKAGLVVCSAHKTRGQVSQPLVSPHLVLPQMIWQGQHSSQHPRMPGPRILCIPQSWPRASPTLPSLTRRPLPLLQPSTPRWGTNRCVFLLSPFPFPSYCRTHTHTTGSPDITGKHDRPKRLAQRFVTHYQTGCVWMNEFILFSLSIMARMVAERKMCIFKTQRW